MEGTERERRCDSNGELASQPIQMSDDRASKSGLHQTEEQFHTLVDSVEEYAIYMLDPAGNVMTWNAGAQKIKQYAAEEIIGKISPASTHRRMLRPRNRSATCVKQRTKGEFAIRDCAFARMDRPFARKLC
jgi:PAS domain-containing protein